MRALTESWYTITYTYDDLVAYTAMDDSLSDSDEREYTLCSATILLYTSDFTRYSWANTINDRCNLLKNEYNTTAPKTIYVHRDQLNNTVALTDQSGAIVQQYSYDVYGKPYILIGTGMVSMDEYTNNPMYTGNMHGNTRLFTGREYDGETGLYYFRARMYSANLGRFMNRDPIGMGDSVNLYMYVGDNPMGGVDPSGCDMLGDIGDDIPNDKNFNRDNNSSPFFIGWSLLIWDLTLIAFGPQKGLVISTGFLEYFLWGNGKERHFGSNSIVADKLRMTSYYQDGQKRLWDKIIIGWKTNECISINLADSVIDENHSIFGFPYVQFDFWVSFWTIKPYMGWEVSMDGTPKVHTYLLYEMTIHSII